jgi:ribulose-phosphate 3-epimerase
MPLRISASIAAAQSNCLQETIKGLEESKVDFIHFDLEDGKFVESSGLSIKQISDLRQFASIPFETHLMVFEPESLIEDLVKVGVNRIAVHYESLLYPRAVLRKITEAGAVAGLAFNPVTAVPFANLTYLLQFLSFVLILTTEPECKDPPFLEEILEKVRVGKQHSPLNKLEWIVDGGVSSENIKMISDAGADTVVIGRALFKQGNIKDNVEAIRSRVK